MSILNVNQIQPVGSGQTVTISATNISAGSATLTAGTFTGNLTGNVTGNLTGNVTSSSTSTFTNGLNVTGGSVGIGTDNPSTPLHVLGDVTIANTSDYGQINLDGAASSNDYGRINFQENGTIRSYVTDNVIATAVHLFQNKPLTISTNNTERVRITGGGDVQIANGNLVFSTSGTGIDFSATSNSSGTMSSELLDDYEEGSWTPTVTTASITVNHARYRKIGSMVYVTCSLDVTVGGSNGSAHIYGLPFAVDNSTGNNYVATESRRVNEDPTILYSIGFGASSIANLYVGRQFSGSQISAVYSNSTSTGQPLGSASWQINVTNVRLVVYGWYVAA